MTRSSAIDRNSPRRKDAHSCGLDRLRNAMTPGSDQLGVMICYEGIYTRDHLEDLTDMPWWAWHAPDMGMRQEAYRRFVAGHELDCLVLRDGPTHDERTNLRIESDGDRAWIVNCATSMREELIRPAIGGGIAAHLAIVFTLLSAIFVILVGIYTEDAVEVHYYVSVGFFMSFLVALFFYAWTLHFSDALGKRVTELTKVVFGLGVVFTALGFVPEVETLATISIMIWGLVVALVIWRRGTGTPTY